MSGRFHPQSAKGIARRADALTDYRDLLREAVRAFPWGTEEPVDGGNAVEFFAAWVERVNATLTKHGDGRHVSQRGLGEFVPDVPAGAA